MIAVHNTAFPNIICQFMSVLTYLMMMMMMMMAMMMIVPISSKADRKGQLSLPLLIFHHLHVFMIVYISQAFVY